MRANHIVKFKIREALAFTRATSSSEAKKAKLLINSIKDACSILAFVRYTSYIHVKKGDYSVKTFFISPCDEIE